VQTDHPLALSRRSWLAGTGLLLTGRAASAVVKPSTSGRQNPIRLSLNENAYGPSPRVAQAIARALDHLERYVDDAEVRDLAAQIAGLEQVSPEQVILGDVLAPLGLFLARQHGGGEIVYSSPGYTELVDAAAPLGGMGKPVPLNHRLENDLAALARSVDQRTIAVSLVNPHNPSGTVNDAAAFDAFVRVTARRSLVIVDEAYLEYDDFANRSAIRLTREGADVLVYRTLGKIYGLAGLAFGYAIAPVTLATSLRDAGIGAAHSLNRLALTAAAAALADQEHVARVRVRVASERQRLSEEIDRLGLEHPTSRASFIYFRSPRPGTQIRAAFAAAGIEIGRGFPPLDD
jgi:histidinol-phosphate aminotransferase